MTDKKKASSIKGPLGRKPTHDGLKKRKGVPKEIKGYTFTAGNTAGKAGRADGSRSNAQLALDAIGQGGSEEALKVIVDAALAGDLDAAKYLLDRCWKPRKGRPLSLDVPKLETIEDLETVTKVIWEKVTGGEYSVEEATALTNLLEFRRQVFELVDMAARMRDLEQIVKTAVEVKK